MDLMKKYLSRVKVNDSKSDTRQEKGHVVKNQKAYKIYSKILDDFLWLVATDEEMQKLIIKGIKEPIYTHNDIKTMDGISKETLRKIHTVKRVFPGSTVLV